ncbi:uncharacterized protein CC84DRAFT_123419 [Paraphaeosphaeria sporulosa]|uniref:Uncharacterized protein n=1 Tax=Paraphaeosphaeria sporulosa TaxID=1460663 RepID=A0A177CY39_9PLEO|nr:uncharacterized protein CC84DRAFT_123419 [Paraphaeosphaeria sporulosa]OAG12453.1 hypothetical protein CC84DRAFT_123419 [Paraphaeosphaeria sporulosa]
MRSASSSLGRRSQRHRAITCGRQRAPDQTALGWCRPVRLPAARGCRCRTPGDCPDMSPGRRAAACLPEHLSPAVLGLALAQLPRAVVLVCVCCHRRSDIPPQPPTLRLAAAFCIRNGLPRRLCCLCAPIVRPLACLRPPRRFLRQVPHRPTLPAARCPPC